MSIRINQNTISLLIQRNLSKVSQRLETSFQRLSSGERIRQSVDDPTGLSSSQQIRYEIRGLQRNQQNIGGGLSMIGTAETGLANIRNLLDRAREKVVQAGNDTLSSDNRDAIKIELSQILAEIDRESTQANYLGRKLLDGTLAQTAIQVGTQAGQTLTISLQNFQTSTLGQVARAIGLSGVAIRPIRGNGDLAINGITVPQTVQDGISSQFSDSSAIAKARAINSITGRTNVQAQVEPTEFQISGATISPVFIDGSTNQLLINGVSISNVVVTDGDTDGTLVEAINLNTVRTGVSASVDSTGHLKLTAVDGRNIDITTTGSIADELGLALIDGDLTDVVTTAKIKLTSDTPFGIGGELDLIGFDVNQNNVAMDPTTALSNLDISTGAAASATLEMLDVALHQLSAAFSTIGALQNRLDGLAESHANRIEELTAADSRIRDTDFALETARLTQNQILQDVAIALLAQANISPQNALRLLRQ